MNKKGFAEAMNMVSDKYYEEAANYQHKKKNSVWGKRGVVAACFCLVITVSLLSVNAYAANNNKALLEIDTIPPVGLCLTIVDATPDDAEFLITNDTKFQVEYGKANRIERYDGENWIEVTSESVGIFPATTVTLQSGYQMYGMCGWVSKRLILEAGTYRYLLVIDVQDADNGTYPVVLKAEFEIQ